MKKTALLRSLILDEGILVMPGVFDSISAILAEKAGFKSIILGGYPTAATRLGKPDLSLVTLTEMVDHVRNIVEAVEIPVFVDGDTGHGELLNVRRTVREFERAGVAGLFIEDQVFPKRCGHMEGKQVIPAEEMVAKIKVALDARIDEDLVIMARTDARAVNGLDDAIRRANLYREAGADLIFVEAPQSVAEMRKIITEVDAPNLSNMVEGGKTPRMDARELAQIGYDVVAFPLSALLSAAHSIAGVFKVLFETGSTEASLDGMMTFSEFNRLLRLESFQNFINRYQS
ncbi:MAG: oxaloacetate decarboxylase [Desulfobacterales bacterium]|nr:oxaloacetate decarboxylase [Desulfobacterales bacterium]MDD4073536.1 oxaloacetate decarboxylase [Desulfobacterales bacterium]MDD4394169.1 oxaloacetate decarboxylase [Desulfobacterales bacterium]